MSKNVLTSVEDGVATLTLNRPAVLNALDVSAAGMLVRAIQTCTDDSDTRWVILTGAGRGFCAGGDMKAVWEHVQNGGDAGRFLRDLTMFLHQAISDLRLMEKPVIAMINGPVSGPGMRFPAASDLRFAAESARVKQAFTSIGLTPDSGWTALVPRLIGPAKAMELLLLDPVLDAAEALALGLVHEVVPDDGLTDRVREVAIELVRGPTAAFGGVKALVNEMLFSALETQLKRERQCIISQADTPEFQEGLSAFVEKREPRFCDGS
jgi:2-(1,2-epoxy-1,2-dihydrophenyl)acetyl-CoA isomerase